MHELYYSWAITYGLGYGSWHESHDIEAYVIIGSEEFNSCYI
jgi:hypothetical protein